MASIIERRLAKFLRRRGYFVGKGRNQSERYSVDYLSTYAFDIATFVDVGVLDGTPVFYELFKDRKIVMVDPLPKLDARVKHWADRGLDTVVINAGAGAAEGVANLTVAGEFSSFLKRLDGRGDTTRHAEARIATLDTLLAERHIEGPFGLKIDTEGFELEVLKGATQTLRNTKFVFAEVNLAHRFEGSYRPSQMFSILAENGFELADPIPNANHSRHFDGLFVKAP